MENGGSSSAEIDICAGEDCNNKENEKEGIERRSFLGAATAAAVGVTIRPELSLRSELSPQQRQPPTNALNDPTVIQDMVSFKSGPGIIQGYLARPRKAGRFPAVVVLHGNLHLPEDHRYTAAQLAQVGLVGLAIKRFSRTPELSPRSGRLVIAQHFSAGSQAK